MHTIQHVAIAGTMAALFTITTSPARADIPQECWVHMDGVFQAQGEHYRLKRERNLQAHRIERSMTEAARTANEAGLYGSLAVLQRFFETDLPDFLQTILAMDDAHDAMEKPLMEFVQCARDEDWPDETYSFQAEPYVIEDIPTVTGEVRPEPED